ncbi:hypothetical protein [endosymbiont 'TC1' of Trimyema compressum]
MDQIKDVATNLKNYFKSGKTIPYSFRIEALKKLKKALEKSYLKH